MVPTRTGQLPCSKTPSSQTEPSPRPVLTTRSLERSHYHWCPDCSASVSCFLLRSPAFLTMTMRKWKMAIAGIMSSCWAVLLSWLWPWENGRWRLLELCLLVEQSRFLDHVMEDGVRVVYQVGRGVELLDLPLVQHQNPATCRAECAWTLVTWDSALA